MQLSNAAADAGTPGADTGASHSDTWSLHEAGDEPDTRERGRALFALGNGSLGVLGWREEECFVASAPLAAVYVNGLYETVPVEYHEKFPGFATRSDTRPQVANPLPFSIGIDGEWLGERAGSVRENRTLDMRSGVLTRRLSWRSARGHTFEVIFERITSLARREVLASRNTVISSDFSGEILLCSALDGHAAPPSEPVSDDDDPRLGPGFRKQPWRLREQIATADELAMSHETACSHLRSSVCVVHTPPVVFSSATAVTPWRLAAIARMSVQQGRSICLEKFAAFVGDELPRARQLAAEAARAGFDALIAEHRDVLRDFWHRATVTLNASPDYERAVRFNLFQLFQAVGRVPGTSISAKGQTGRAYEGHYFWDAEVFCLPMFAFCAPALARNILRYRHETLDAARENARIMGHRRGALFAWRTIGGRECSAYFPAGAAQYHLNAGIAHAVRQFWEATGDRDFLASYGAELVIETARIWLEVGFFNARRDHEFCIPCVTGPDEYTALVDNNFYTNAMAQAHLEFTVHVCNMLHTQLPLRWRDLARQLQIEPDEIALWSRAARRMYLPYDRDLQIFKQDDTFLDRKPWENIAGDDNHTPLLLRFHPLVLYRHQLCKQADAVLALCLLSERFTPADRRRTFEYYERCTVHDSTLSPGIFSIVASDIGDSDKAYRYAVRTANIDLEDLHGNTKDGLHMAAMGASWMALVIGYAGMRFIGGTPSFRPQVPGAMAGYSFRVQIRGSLLEVDVDPDGTHYRLLEGEALGIRHCDRRLTLETSSPVYVPNASAATPIEELV
jgi:alpha,alpha-trehalose phosphorylase